MSEPAHDHKLQAATESTLAKAVGRFLTPLLLAVIAWLGNNNFIEFRETQKQQGAQIQEVRSDLKLLNAKVDYSVLQQLATLDRRVQLLEDQNRVLRESK